MPASAPPTSRGPVRPDKGAAAGDLAADQGAGVERIARRMRRRRYGEAAADERLRRTVADFRATGSFDRARRRRGEQEPADQGGDKRGFHSAAGRSMSKPAVIANSSETD